MAKLGRRVSKLVSGDPDEMISAVSSWSSECEHLRRRAGRVSDSVAWFNRSGAGVGVADPFDGVAGLARRWVDLAELVVEVANKLRQADQDRMASIAANGISTADDALWFSQYAGVFEAPIDDVGIAALGLFAIAPDLDTARDRVRGDESEADGVLSLEDLRAMAGSELYSDEQRLIAQRLLDYVEGNEALVEELGLKGDGGLTWGDVASGALTVAGFVPVVGDAIDAVALVYYVAQGDWVNAAASGLGMVPIPGVTGGSVRAARGTLDELVEVGAQEGAKGVAREVALGTVQEAFEEAVRNEVDEAVVNATGSEDLGATASLAVGLTLGAARADTTDGFVDENFGLVIDASAEVATNGDG